jgi:hypothetical protein
MFSIGSIFSPRSPPPARVDLALRSHGRRGGLDEGERPSAATDHVYFSVRSLGFSGPSHLLQYAFVDDRGNIVLSTVSALPRPNGPAGCEPPEDLAIEPLEPEALAALLGRVCPGARLVAFGRVLQGSLLPASSARAAYSVDCAWRRFMRLSRQRRMAVDRNAPVTLPDAMAIAGLPPLESGDAGLRALAIRDLWTWMDRVETRTGWA